MQIIYSMRTTTPILLIRIFGNGFCTHKTAVYVKSKEPSVIVFVYRRWCHVRVFLLTGVFA